MAGLQQGQRAFGRPRGGALARAVAIETEGRFRHQAPEFAHLVFRQSRTQRRHGLGESGLGQCNHVHIPFGHDDLAGIARRAQRLAQAIERASLVEERGLRRVQVFRLALAQDAPAKGDHPAAAVGDGKDHPAAHAIEDMTVVALADQAGLDGKLQRDARLGQRIAQRRTTIGRVAQAKSPNSCITQTPALQVVQRLASTRRLQLLLVPGSRRFHGRDQGRLALAAFALFGRGDGDRQSRLACEPFHRVGKAQAVAAHDETDDIAMGPAAEAMKETLLVAHGEGGRLFVMEGTETRLLAPASGQLDLAGNDIHQGNALAQLVEERGRETHGEAPSEAKLSV